MTQKAKQQVTRLRGKSIKIRCTEETALQIVVPFVNFTAYMLSVDTAGAMPAIDSIKNSVLSAKTAASMQQLLANLLTQGCSPETSIAMEEAIAAFAKVQDAIIAV